MMVHRILEGIGALAIVAVLVGISAWVMWGDPRQRQVPAAAAIEMPDGRTAADVYRQFLDEEPDKAEVACAARHAESLTSGPDDAMDVQLFADGAYYAVIVFDRFGKGCLLDAGFTARPI